MKSLPVSLLLLTVIPLFLFACGSGEHEDIKLWMTESTRDLRGSVPPLPELKPFPIVSYEASDKPDPFGSERLEPERKEGVGGKRPDFDRPREQLESFPLETLNFVGVVSHGKTKARHALINADGVVYRAEKGNYIGQNFGRILDISDNEIVLLETVQDPSGQSSDWVERKMTLQLQEGTKGKEAGK